MIENKSKNLAAILNAGLKSMLFLSKRTKIFRIDIEIISPNQFPKAGIILYSRRAHFKLRLAPIAPALETKNVSV